MLAKGFKREKAQEAHSKLLSEDRSYKLENKKEHFESVKQRKLELDKKFNIKMKAANEKIAQR